MKAALRNLLRRYDNLSDLPPVPLDRLDFAVSGIAPEEAPMPLGPLPPRVARRLHGDQCYVNGVRACGWPSEHKGEPIERA
jgi:hypothetical protein